MFQEPAVGGSIKRRMLDGIRDKAEGDDAERDEAERLTLCDRQSQFWNELPAEQVVEPAIVFVVCHPASAITGPLSIEEWVFGRP
jgi:hypothetical protein